MNITRNEFVHHAKALGASILYAPESPADPLANLGTLVTPDAVLKGATKLAVPGLLGGAALLDQPGGEPDFVETQAQVFNNIGSQTFCGFFRRDVLNEHAALFAAVGSSGPMLYCLASGEGGGIGWTANNFGEFDWWAGYTPQVGVTFFWAFVFQPLTNKATLYINGVSQGELEHVANYPATQKLTIGQGNWASGNGSALPFAVFPKVLEASQVAWLYESWIRQRSRVPRGGMGSVS